MLKNDRSSQKTTVHRIVLAIQKNTEYIKNKELIEYLKNREEHMRRKLITLIVGICLILAMVPSAAFAETESDAAEKLLTEKMDEAAELIHGQEMETELYETAEGSYCGTEVYDLGDGAQLIVEITDTDVGVDI